ncbi:MAG: undecaprenyl-diphosphate phosphatase [Phycisphaerales bacterium]
MTNDQKAGVMRWWVVMIVAMLLTITGSVMAAISNQQSAISNAQAADRGSEAAAEMRTPEPRTPNPDPSMSVGQAMVLGLVEGITEYLPVSSTGHLLVAQRWMGIENSDAANAYAIVIQGGAILAVLLLYFSRVKQACLGVIGRDEQGRRLAINLWVSLLPLVIAVVLEKQIKHHLFGPWPVVGAWFVGGAAILAVAWRRKSKGERPQQGLTIADMTWRMSLIIGLSQIIAVWPGVSRSLVTIVAGVLVGLSLPAAVEFSFLLGVLTLGGATLKDAVEYRHDMLHAYSPAAMLLGIFVAFVSAALAIKWMVAYLNKHGLQLFGYYRIAAAVIVAAMLWWKVI